jgi:hypothetical protein
MNLWPQYAVIALSAIGFGINVAKFGQPKTGDYDFIDLIVGPAFSYTLLYYGGFFAPMGFAP